MHPEATSVLLALQLFHVLFLLFHDWIPLGRLNDVAAIRAQNPGRKVLIGTAVSSLPFVFGFISSVVYLGRAYPGWLFWWLWISYTWLFVGELEVWWVPFLFRPQPARAARYALMFSTTHAFLPMRNGIRVNTLHVVLHAATVMTLVVLVVVTLR